MDMIDAKQKIKYEDKTGKDTTIGSIRLEVNSKKLNEPMFEGN